MHEMDSYVIGLCRNSNRCLGMAAAQGMPIIRKHCITVKWCLSPTRVFWPRIGISEDGTLNTRWMGHLYYVPIGWYCRTYQKQAKASVFLSLSELQLFFFERAVVHNSFQTRQLPVSSRRRPFMVKIFTNTTNLSQVYHFSSLPLSS